MLRVLRGGLLPTRGHLAHYRGTRACRSSAERADCTPTSSPPTPASRPTRACPPSGLHACPTGAAREHHNDPAPCRPPPGQGAPCETRVLGGCAAAGTRRAPAARPAGLPAGLPACRADQLRRLPRAFWPQMHYTWGSVFNAPNGTKVWEFDKRYYTEAKHEKTVRHAAAAGTGWRRCGPGSWVVAQVGVGGAGAERRAVCWAATWVLCSMPGAAWPGRCMRSRPRRHLVAACIACALRPARRGCARLPTMLGGAASRVLPAP